MSEHPEPRSDVQMDSETSDAPVATWPARSFINLAMPDPPIPDSPDSPDEQPAPAPQPSTIRPGEQGSDFLLPGRREMAFLKRTVLHPIYTYYEILAPDISILTKHSDFSVNVLAFPSPPNTSAEDLELWFQRLETMFDLVPQISCETKIFTMIGATAAVQSTDLLRFFLRLRNTTPLGTQAYEQFKSYLKHRLVCETPTKCGGGMWWLGSHNQDRYINCENVYAI
ncbi:unnamed protein product [Clavelina lepadiformis]|uniref:Gag protein n=1 Tax=Clavelina lepadiformis TaxID=159417 RepID=A0ABP0EWB7_CLALP